MTCVKFGSPHKMVININNIVVVVVVIINCDIQYRGSLPILELGGALVVCVGEAQGISYSNQEM